MARIIYLVTDRNDKDREDPMIDFFETREAAEQFAAEWSAAYGECQIEEWTGTPEEFLGHRNE